MEEKDVCNFSEEVLRIMDEFRQKIISGTKDPDNFLTISDIERLWSELRGDTSLLYSDMLASLLAEIDEAEVIRKKKLNTRAKE